MAKKTPPTTNHALKLANTALTAATVIMVAFFLLCAVVVIVTGTTDGLPALGEAASTLFRAFSSLFGRP